MDFTIKIIVGILGILFYSLFKAREYIVTNEFELTLFWQENRLQLGWSVIMILLINIFLLFAPDGSEAIRMFSGLDLENTVTGFFTLGIALSGTIRNATKETKK